MSSHLCLSFHLHGTTTWKLSSEFLSSLPSCLTCLHCDLHGVARHTWYIRLALAPPSSGHAELLPVLRSAPAQLPVLPHRAHPLPHPPDHTTPPLVHYPHSQRLKQKDTWRSFSPSNYTCASLGGTDLPPPHLGLRGAAGETGGGR